MNSRTLIIALSLLTPLSLSLALMLGSVSISWGEFWSTVSGQEKGLFYDVVFELRLPRAISAFATGGLLALAGALMQILLRNPLADPYILGISGGASVGALIALLLGLGSAWLTGSAFIGALLSMYLVFSLAQRQGSWTHTRLLLTGIVVAAGWGAIISFMLVIAPSTNLRGMLFWLMGDLSYADNPLIGMIVLSIGLAICLPMARDLNVMARGELQARALGVDSHTVRRRLYILASLMTATAVTMAGSIGFVGLIVPHLIRLLIGNDQRVLIPAAVLLGGSLLVIADTLARTALAPQQLPVGILTAIIGVPTFLFLLERSQTR